MGIENAKIILDAEDPKIVIGSGANTIGFDSGAEGFFVGNTGVHAYKLRIGNTSTSTYKNRLTWDGANLRVFDRNGNAVLNSSTGADAAIAGWTGTISGFTNSNNTVGMWPSDYPFFAGSDGATRSTAKFKVDTTGAITATAGTIASWTITTSGLASNNNTGARILLNNTNNRISVLNSAGSEITAMGYLNGLPKNDGSGNWTISNYGFYAASGQSLTIDGDADYKDGDWIIQKDAAYLIKDVSNNIIGRFGNEAGTVGLFLYNTAGTKLSSFTGTGVQIGSGANQLYYSTTVGLIISGNLSATTGNIGGWVIGSTALYSSDSKIYLDSSNKKITLGDTASTIGFDAGARGVYIGLDTDNKYKLRIGNISTDQYNIRNRLTWDGVDLKIFDKDNNEVITSKAGSSATIAGWNATNLYLVSSDDSEGLSPADYPFYAGATYANRANAPFRIHKSGSIVSTSGTIGGWILGTNTIQSTGGNASITLDTTKARISIGNPSDPYVAMGYLDQLTKHGGGTWGASDYGFWAREGNHLQIDGDAKYINGDWLIYHNASYRILVSGTNNDVAKFGTHNGVNGVFFFDGVGGTTPIAKYTSNAIQIGSGTQQLYYTPSVGLVISGNITANTGSIGGWKIGATSLYHSSNNIYFDASSNEKITLGTTASAITFTSGDGIFIGYDGASPTGYKFRAGKAGANRMTWDGVDLKILDKDGNEIIKSTSNTSLTIAGWKTDTTSFKSTDGKIGLSTGTDAFWAGNSATPTNCEFYVSSAGALKATGATISGTITATSGKIGGWDISGTAIQKLSSNIGIKLDPDTPIIKIGDLNGTYMEIDGSSANKRIRSYNYSSNSVGWCIDAAGNADFASANIRGKLSSSVFVKGITSVIAGTQMIAKAGAILYSSVTTGGSGSIVVEVPDGYDPQNDKVFTTGDQALLQTASGNSTYSSIIQVTYTTYDATARTQTYSFTTISGSGTFSKGTAITNLGTTGQGIIKLTVNNDNTDSSGASMSLYTYNAGGTFTPNARFGNIRNSFGIDNARDYWGFAAGNTSSSVITADHYNGLQIRSGIQLNGSSLEIGKNGFLYKINWADSDFFSKCIAWVQYNNTNVKYFHVGPISDDSDSPKYGLESNDASNMWPVSLKSYSYLDFNHANAPSVPTKVCINARTRGISTTYPPPNSLTIFNTTQGGISIVPQNISLSPNNPHLDAPAGCAAPLGGIYSHGLIKSNTGFETPYSISGTSLNINGYNVISSSRNLNNINQLNIITSSSALAYLYSTGGSYADFYIGSAVGDATGNIVFTQSTVEKFKIYNERTSSDLLKIKGNDNVDKFTFNTDGTFTSVSLVSAASYKVGSTAVIDASRNYFGGYADLSYLKIGSTTTIDSSRNFYGATISGNSLLINGQEVINSSKQFITKTIYNIAGSELNINLKDAHLSVYQDTSTTAPLAVFAGENAASYVAIDANVSSGVPHLIFRTNGSDIGRIYSTNNSTQVFSFAYTSGGADSELVRINSSGDISAIGEITAFANLSDIKYKTKINLLTPTLDKINKLRPVTFNWKHHEDIPENKWDKLDIGLIAQEVENIIPEIVFDHEMLSSGKSSKRVRYEKLIPYIIKAIQELYELQSK